jgi:hypothetical protein
MHLIDLCDWKSNTEESMLEKSKLIDQLVSKLSSQAADSSNIENIVGGGRGKEEKELASNVMKSKK